MNHRARWATAAMIIALLVFGPRIAQAAAWTKKAGEGQVINTFTYYVADRSFNEDGDTEDTPRFEKVEYSPYVEYGVTDAFTVGFQPFFQYARQDLNAGTVSNVGLGDVEIFARERLWSGDRAVLSVQQLISVPGGSDAGESPPLGRDQVDIEGRVLFGTSAPVMGVESFYNAELGFRKRFQAPADEVRVDLTAGVKPTPDWMILVQSFNTIGLGNAADGPIVQTSAPNFDRYKIQLSVVRDLTEALSIQVGGFSEYAGRNTGQGNAGFMALWISF